MEVKCTLRFYLTIMIMAKNKNSTDIHANENGKKEGPSSIAGESVNW